MTAISRRVLSICLAAGWLCSLAAAQSVTSSQTFQPSPSTVTPAVSGTGTTDFIPLWTNTTGGLGNSVIFQSGSGATAKVGINLTTPGSTLDVNGAATVRGLLNLPATAAATTAGGKNSQPSGFTASSYNSGTDTAVNQNFRWQAEPAANNTTAPSGTLNLLYSSGTATPAETGLKINNKGVITFAAGQTFPGGGAFCIATAGGFGDGGSTFVEPGFTVPAENKCTSWSGFTKTASTVILNTSGAACLSSTGKTLTVSVSSADPDFLGTNPTSMMASDYIQLTRASSTGSFTGGTDQGQNAGSANQVTCTSSLLTLPDIHD